MSVELVIYLALGAVGLFVFLSVMVLVQTWVERKALIKSRNAILLPGTGCRAGNA